MDKPILLVDDEVNILNSFRRTLRNQVTIELASSGKEALELIEKKHYAVVVSDMNMPEMNGLQLLEAIQERSPDTVRMMFTGNSDQKTAVDAVNIGDVFRFINKPCSPDELLVFINSALHQYDLIIAEKVLLNKTLKGVISVLSEVISLIEPEVSEHNSRIQFHMDTLSKALKLKSHWSFEPMVQLSQLGHILFPDEQHNGHLTVPPIPEQSHSASQIQQSLGQHAALASDLIRRIPRMGPIANAIKYQEKGFNGEGLPNDEVQGKDLPLGSRMLKVICDYTRLEKSGVSPTQAIQTLESQKELYDPTIFSAFKTTLVIETPCSEIKISQIKIDMILNEDIRTDIGQLVAREGQKTTDALLNIIRYCQRNGAISWDAKISVLAADETEDVKLKEY